MTDKWGHVISLLEGSAALSDNALNSLKDELRASPSAQSAWQAVSQRLQPSHDFALHQELLAAVYKDWPHATKGPHPIWQPSREHIRGHNITRFLQHFKGDSEFEAARTGDPVQDWAALHALSVRSPDIFWHALLLQELGLVVQAPPTRMLQPNPNPDECAWLPGASLNAAWAALHSPHVDSIRDPTRPAILWAAEGSPSHVQAVSWGELREAAAQVAAALRTLVGPGDTVGVMLPLTPVAAAVYFGIVLAGACVVSIADSFSAQEVATRLSIVRAKLIFTQDVVVRGGKALPLFERVADACAPRAIILPCTLYTPTWAGATSPATATGRACSSGALHPKAVGRLRAGDLHWDLFMALAPGGADAGRAALAAARAAGVAPYGRVADGGAVAGLAANGGPGACLHLGAAPNDPTNILFSSGTTGEPKAIVWTHTTPLRCAADGWAHQGIGPADIVSWPTSLGWMMGPWLLYATLLNGATIALYNGAPLGRDFGEFVGAARVSVLGLVPSIVRSWRHSGCMQDVSWPALRVFSSTGEASAPDDYHWLVALTRYRAPVVEYCGGTELGGAYITSTTLHPHAPSTFSTPAIGTQLVLLSSSTTSGGAHLVQSPHGPQAPATVGEVALVAPLLGASQRLLNRDHYEAYYVGMPLYAPTGRPLRRHGDELARLPGGYYQALGRCDDTMNLGGIKVSSVELERAVVEGVVGVAEAAAIGVPSPGGGPELLVLCLVLTPPPATSPAAAATASGPPATAPVADPAQETRLLAACTAALRTCLNPLFRPSRVMVVASLPRNASNKVMRRTLRDALMAARANGGTQPRL